MRKINTIDEFWEAIDEIRIEKNLNWSDLVGGKAKLATSKKWNLTLMNILQIQKELDVDIINTLAYQLFDTETNPSKDPETPQKMALIHQWIQEDNWMENEETVQKVQELAMTII